MLLVFRYALAALGAAARERRELALENIAVGRQNLIRDRQAASRSYSCVSSPSTGQLTMRPAAAGFAPDCSSGTCSSNLMPQCDVLEHQLASFPGGRPQRRERVSEDQQH